MLLKRYKRNIELDAVRGTCIEMRMLGKLFQLSFYLRWSRLIIIRLWAIQLDKLVFSIIIFTSNIYNTKIQSIWFINSKYKNKTYFDEYFIGILKFEIINENINIMITRLISYSYYKVSLYSSFCFCRLSYFMINYAK